VRAWLAALAPGLVAAAAFAAAFAIDDTTAWVQQAQAVLFSSARLALAAWPLWAIVGVVRTRLWRRHLLLGAVGGLAGGLPWGSPPEGLVVASANLDAFASEGRAVEADLAALHADVLFTIELRALAIDGMRRVADNFDRGLAKPSWGLGVFCREDLACSAQVGELLGEPTCAMPYATLVVDDLCVLALHLPPPVSGCNAGRVAYMAHVNEHLWGGRISRDLGACSKGDRALVIGDLNSTPGMWVHQDLVSRGFRDAFRARGVWAGTWPAGGGYSALPLTQLDHALAGETVQTHGPTTFAIPGSDHRGVMVGVR